MNINYIREKIANCRSDRLHEYSILIPIIEINNDLHLIFEIRSHQLESQPGEICFPGGKKEELEHPKYAAVRETMEELNLSEENIEIFGSLTPLYTPFNYKINNYVGLIKGVNYKDIVFNTDEVHDIFTVPLDYLKNYEVDCYNFDVKMDIPTHFPFQKIQNGKDYSWKTGNYEVCFYEYQDKIIWGMTAKMLKSFLDKI